MTVATLLLRCEGPLQAWGDQQSKFVIRRTAEAPTKSGIFGILCAALGVSRVEAAKRWLAELGALRMGVRIDRPGVRWWDYHTVGARMRLRTAEGKSKTGALLSRREYLCDASFLVALQGDPELIARIRAALAVPKWPPFLGRKCCPPSRPILDKADGAGRTFESLEAALWSVAWQPRYREERRPRDVDCLFDWQPTESEPEAPDNALVWYDVPVSFDPPAHVARFVLKRKLSVGGDAEVPVAPESAQQRTPPPLRLRADYGNEAYKKRRRERLALDHHLCVFCKAPATTVQHVTYRRAGGDETLADLRALCRLCHDAVTMIEYGLDMGLDRIDPEEPRWRETIIAKRDEIIRFRSLETRRRRLALEEVE